MKSLLDAMADGALQIDGHKMADLTEKLDPQEHREFRSGAGICQ